MENTKIRPKVKLIGKDGNAWVIMGLCQRAAKQAGWTAEEIEKVISQMQSGDYNHLLQVAMEHFDVY